MNKGRRYELVINKEELRGENKKVKDVKREKLLMRRRKGVNKGRQGGNKGRRYKLKVINKKQQKRKMNKIM